MRINPKVTIENVGGKGYQLSYMKDFCPVPDFFILRFDKNDEIDRAGVQNKILKHFKEQGFNLVSVRSSATLEDSSSASFAGMFETELNVTGETLIPAIKKVLLSVQDLRVKQYCQLNNLDYTAIHMRVIVQKMVQSRVSGVCFTRENRTSNTLLMEACYGLGEALVSGLVTPDTYRVDRDTLTILSKNIGFQKTMVGVNGTQEVTPVPFHKRNAKKLTDLEIEELTKMGMLIEKKMGYFAADIEWAYEGSKSFFLQVRPLVGI